MLITFHKHAWEDYLYWQQTDKKMLKKINKLIEEISRSPFHGTGKPEPLKHALSGCWSRRVNAEHRIVYQIIDDRLVILQCRYHY
jgi:toxin YoeB